MDSGIAGQEPFGVAVQMSGTDIVNAICDEIAASLARSCDLRATDSYRSFSARAVVDVQLVDLDTTEIAQEISIGKLNPALPVEHVEVDLPAARRQYVSRVRTAK